MTEIVKEQIISYLKEALEDDYEYAFFKLADIKTIENAISIRHKVQTEKSTIVPIINGGTIEDFKEEFQNRMAVLKRKVFKYNKNYKLSKK